jgi:hypothetical protein
MHLPETWLDILAVLLLLGAMMGGALTAFLLLTDRSAPVNLGFLHGGAGATGILLLLLAVLLGQETHSSMTAALGLFMLTGVGGVTLYFLIRRKGVLPKLIIFAHGGLAISAMAVLLFGRLL